METDSFLTVTRRAFLRAGALALVSFGLDPLFLARAAFAQRPEPSAAGRRVLVCLFQRGAVDGLSMVVPHGDAAYYRERPRIAIPRDAGAWTSTATSGSTRRSRGLHAAVAAGRARARARGGIAGYTRSHFDAQDYMESGHARASSPRPTAGSIAYAQHAARASQHAVSGGGVRAAAAAHPGGQRSGARDLGSARVRHSRRPSPPRVTG